MNNDLLVPPQIQEAEDLLIAGLLQNPQAITGLRGILRPEVLSRTAHSWIYQAALLIEDQGHESTLEAIAAVLAAMERLERLGGKEMLLSMVGDQVVEPVIAKGLALLIADRHKQFSHAGMA